MKSILNLRSFSILAVMFCLFAAAVEANAQIVDAEKSLPANLWANNNISGAWRINYAESDNTLLKTQAMLKNKIAQSAETKTAEAKTDAMPTMSISLFPPESLILAGENEKEMTINEGYNDFVLTRTVLTDGRTQIGEVEGGANYRVTAAQRKDYLKIETVSPRGNKMTETFALAEDGRKMIVTVKVEDSINKELITLKRVYDRTMLDVFDGLAPEIQ